MSYNKVSYVGLNCIDCPMQLSGLGCEGCLMGLGDILSEAKDAVTSFLNANKSTVSMDIMFCSPRLNRDIYRREVFYNNVIPLIVRWVNDKAGVAPTANFVATLKGEWAKSEVVVPICKNVSGIYMAWPGVDKLYTDLANSVINELDALARQRSEAVKLQVGNLFRAVFSGMTLAPQADVDWGINQVINGGWTLSQLSAHWNDMASQFRTILQAVSWYTNQDDIYEAWRSKAWDVNQTISAITAAHPKPGQPPGGGGGGGSGGTGTGTTNAGMFAGLNFSNPLVLAGIGAVGFLLYWTQVKKKSMGQIPYVGQYMGKISKGGK